MITSKVGNSPVISIFIWREFTTVLPLKVFVMFFILFILCTSINMQHSGNAGFSPNFPIFHAKKRKSKFYTAHLMDLFQITVKRLLALGCQPTAYSQ
jgi:hypothetical protein